MNIKQFFEVQSNDSANPTFFTDYETGELLYLNQAMEKKFQIFEDYTGKTSQDVIPYFSDICGYQDKTQLEEGVFLEDTFLSEQHNTNLRSKATLCHIKGRNYIQTKYFQAPNTDKRQEAENHFEKAIAQCLEILSDSSKASPIADLLKLLGEFYACELTYICEFDRELDNLPHRYVWSKDNKISDINFRTGVESESFIHWLENDQNKSIINLDKSIIDLVSPSLEQQLLSEYNITNITLSKLWNKDGTLMGIVGLSNRADLMYDDRLLQAVSHFIMEQFSQKNIVETMEEFNDIDLLTGFFNRSKYSQKLSILQEKPPKSLGVLFVNLNGLRQTNEYLGYEEGDMQIKKTSSILNQYFNCEFYRITGDEFVGFVEDCDFEIFEETVNALQSTIKEDNHDTSFSFGHSWDEGNYTISELIKIADTVMVINKQAYYSESIKDTQKMTNSILQDLFQGIGEEEFMVYLQPQVDLKTEKVVGAEALIRRLDKKTNKMIFPDSFIPLYEQKSIIRHVDLFVVKKVCQLLQEWKKHGQKLAISVNLSRVTLMEHGIVQTIAKILDEYQIEHDLLVIEITERIGIIENEVASSLVDEFKFNGFKLSLDDFGCAYSNIVTLASISVDEVKIDKSLIDHVLTNHKNSVIVESMLSMCDRFHDTHTLAEGIEEKEQADFLRLANCHLGQGYYYSRPIPHTEFYEKYIKTSTEPQLST